MQEPEEIEEAPTLRTFSQDMSVLLINFLIMFFSFNAVIVLGYFIGLGPMTAMISAAVVSISLVIWWEIYAMNRDFERWKIRRAEYVKRMKENDG